MTDLRVLHVTPALFGAGGVYGGAERYTFELARHMAKLTPTTLIAFGDSPCLFTTAEGLRVRVLGPAWRVRRHRTNRIHHGLISAVARADVVHCHQNHTLAAEFAALIARLTGRHAAASDLGGGSWGFSGYVNTDRWFHTHLHISRYSRDIAGHGVNPAARVIYGGVDTVKFSPDPSVPREPLVLFVGRLMPHKGVADLIDALPDGMRLELIGRPYDEGYHVELKRRAEGKAVTFRHDCDDDELVRAYRRARAVVLPSVYRTSDGGVSKVPELLGQTLLEGMACEAATICTDVASMPEIVVHGSTGLVVPPNDPNSLRQSLSILRDDPELATRMGIVGRGRVLERFTWHAVVDECFRAYGMRKGVRR